MQYIQVSLVQRLGFPGWCGEYADVCAHIARTKEGTWKYIYKSSGQERPPLRFRKKVRLRWSVLVFEYIHMHSEDVVKCHLMNFLY